MRPLVLLTLSATLFAETGVRPRAAASDYAAHQSGAGATVAATILTPDQAKKLFGLDLNKLGYTVAEIAVYPDRNVEVAARDFLLRLAADGRTVRPVAATTIGNKNAPQKAPKVPERVQVYTGGTVGYESGPYRRGVYTGTSVGVGIGAPPAAPPPPPSSGPDTGLLENEALPEGRFDKPVAGYLYFPVTSKKSTVEITWYGAEGQVRLPMPRTK